MSFQDWLDNRWLVEHKTGKNEISDLLGVIDRDLKDCEIKELSADRRLSTAYNAALQVAITALAACGYRTSRESHHYRAIQSLELTLKVSSKIITKFESFQKKRNICDYDKAGSISDYEADQMHYLALELKEKLLKWLKDNHPELIKE